MLPSILLSKEGHEEMLRGGGQEILVSGLRDTGEHWHDTGTMGRYALIKKLNENLFCVFG